MIRLSKPLAVAGLLIAGAAMPAYAQQAADPAAEKAEAVAAVEKMGAYLRSLKGFKLSADTTRDDITESGQNVEMASHLDLKALPNRLFLDVTSDRHHRQFVYDGKTVTVFAPIIGAYAVFDGAETTRETLAIARDAYGLRLPLADLFVWGTDQDSIDALTDGFPVGTSTIGGHECMHYAFRQEGADWQIWIRSGDMPLPCKLVIANTAEESRPRFEATLEWNLDVPVDEDDFVFDPPEEAYQIGMEPLPDTNQ